jgi:hypothetical protein
VAEDALGLVAERRVGRRAGARPRGPGARAPPPPGSRGTSRSGRARGSRRPGGGAGGPAGARPSRGASSAAHCFASVQAASSRSRRRSAVSRRPRSCASRSSWSSRSSRSSRSRSCSKRCAVPERVERGGHERAPLLERPGAVLRDGLVERGHGAVAVVRGLEELRELRLHVEPLGEGRGELPHGREGLDLAADVPQRVDALEGVLGAGVDERRPALDHGPERLEDGQELVLAEGPVGELRELLRGGDVARRGGRGHLPSPDAVRWAFSSSRRRDSLSRSARRRTSPGLPARACSTASACGAASSQRPAAASWPSSAQRSSRLALPCSAARRATSIEAGAGPRGGARRRGPTRPRRRARRPGPGARPRSRACCSRSRASGSRSSATRRPRPARGRPTCRLDERPGDEAPRGQDHALHEVQLELEDLLGPARAGVGRAREAQEGPARTGPAWSARR